MEEIKTERISCDCNKCKNACTYKPGWFKFGEVEKVANYLKISLKELFDNYLAVDWYEDDDNIFVLAPVLSEEEPGSMYPYKPTGTCIFFKNDLCEIHPSSPFECQKYYHGEEHNLVRKRHEDVAKTWVGKEKYIEKLLGHKPCPAENDGSLSIFNESPCFFCDDAECDGSCLLEDIKIELDMED